MLRVTREHLAQENHTAKRVRDSKGQWKAQGLNIPRRERETGGNTAGIN